MNTLSKTKAILIVILFLTLIFVVAAFSGEWQKMAGTAKDIGVGSDGTTWVVGTNKTYGGYDIYRWTGSAWEKKPGSAFRIAVGSSNQIWIVNEFNNIYQWDGSSWQKMPGTGYDIGVGSDGSVWIVGTNKIYGGYDIYRWTGSAWEKKPGGAVRISVGSASLIWTVNELNDVYKWESSNWQKMPGKADDVGVGSDGTVWAVGTNPVSGGWDINQWTGSAWENKPGGAVRIDVGSTNHIWCVDDSDNIYSWKTTPPLITSCFKFNDGTTEGWTLDQIYKNNTQNKISPVFPFKLLNDQNQLAATANPLVIDGQSPQTELHDIYLESPDLSSTSAWQNISGYSIDIQRTDLSYCGDPPNSYIAQLQVRVIDNTDNSEHIFAESNGSTFIFHNMDNAGQQQHFIWKAQFFTETKYKVKNVRIRLTGAGEKRTECMDNRSWRIDNVCAETGQPPSESITVSSPNGGEKWYVGSQQEVWWQSQNFNDPVKIEYSINGGSTWKTITSSTTDKTFPWTIPNDPSTNCLVRVSDAADGNPSDVSDAKFSIIVAKLTIISPNGGEKWHAGTIQNVQWSSQNIPDNDVSIEYSIDNGQTYNFIGFQTNNSSTETWQWDTVPNTPSQNCLIRISLYMQGTQVVDVSDAVFEIAGPYNTQPGTNKTINLGNGVKITFEKVDIGGNTTLDIKNSGPQPPSGFRIHPSGLPVYYSINTTATLSPGGKITICISYNASGLTQADENKLTLQVYENTPPPPHWKDITSSRDLANHKICGEVTHLSDFAVMAPTNNEPVLSVSPTTLDFGVSQTNLSFQISNTGSGTLTWTTSETPESYFTSVNPVSGAGNATVEVQVDRTGMVAGNYTGTIKVSSNGGELNVTVNMAVAGNLPIVKIDPKSLNMRKGSPDSIDIVIENVTNLGGFEFEISFDNAIVTVEQSADVVPGAFVGSTGRAYFFIGPTIDNTAGSVVYAIASFGNQAGPDGSGVLARVIWTPQAEGTTTLDLKNVKVMDINANEIQVIEEDGEINVTTRFWADIDGDEDIDIVDVQLVAAHWNSRVGDSNYDPIYDVDNSGQGDGDVDIVDVQLVASWWNKAIPPLTGLNIQPGMVTDQTNNLDKFSGENQNLNLKIVPEAYSDNGMVTTVAVMIEGATDVAAFQFDVESNADYDNISEIQLGDFFRSSDNNISILGPQKNESGKKTTFGAFSFGKYTGAKGSGVLVRINIKIGLENAADLNITNFKITDVKGNELLGFSVTNDLLSLTGIQTIPEQFSLLQNYPNPFNPETHISYELPDVQKNKTHVSLYIYNMKGQLVRRLVDEEKSPGSHTVLWNGKNELGEMVPSGLFLYSLTAGDFKTSRKMLFLK